VDLPRNYLIDILILISLQHFGVPQIDLIVEQRLEDEVLIGLNRGEGAIIHSLIYFIVHKSNTGIT
jgi:hypothetical protein